MGRLRNLRIALVVTGVLAMAVIASAQVTTGTVTGTVKDPQGGVIPGATVTLTSETRGTKLPDVFTNEGRLPVRQRAGRQVHHPGHDARLQAGQADRRQRQPGRPARTSASSRSRSAA